MSNYDWRPVPGHGVDIAVGVESSNGTGDVVLRIGGGDDKGAWVMLDADTAKTLGQLLFQGGSDADWYRFARNLPGAPNRRLGV